MGMSDASLEQPVDPGPATPDTSDWTWVLTRPCPDCGFDAGDLPVESIPAVLQDAKQRYAAVLTRADVRARPAVGVWSPLEYSCHVRDVCQVFAGRLEQILDGRGELVRFASWDQDETANRTQYWRSDPATVRAELITEFDRAAEVYGRPTGSEWTWAALRSNGARFTAETLAQYFVHDIVHHLWDVRG